MNCAFDPGFSADDVLPAEQGTRETWHRAKIISRTALFGATVTPSNHHRVALNFQPGTFFCISISSFRSVIPQRR